MNTMNDALGDDLDLDLTDNTVSEGMGLLKSGVYDAVSKKPEWKKTSKGSGKMLVIVFEDLKGMGQITFRFNVMNASADAQKIGRDQLKTFLTHGGHPNPDRPLSGYGLDAMEGLKVRILVDADGTYTKDNQTRVSYAIKRFSEVDPNVPAAGPSPMANASNTENVVSMGAAKGANKPLDDEIPF